MPAPTLIIGAQNDTVASVTSHAEPFYNSIPAAAEKAYMELRGASHFVSNSSNTTIARQIDRLAQALRRQRHPVRAVHLPAAERHAPSPSSATPAPADPAGPRAPVRPADG